MFKKQLLSIKRNINSLSGGNTALINGVRRKLNNSYRNYEYSLNQASEYLTKRTCNKVIKTVNKLMGE